MGVFREPSIDPMLTDYEKSPKAYTTCLDPLRNLKESLNRTLRSYFGSRVVKHLEKRSNSLHVDQTNGYRMKTPDRSRALSVEISRLARETQHNSVLTLTRYGIVVQLPVGS